MWQMIDFDTIGSQYCARRAARTAAATEYGAKKRPGERDVRYHHGRQPVGLPNRGSLNPTPFCPGLFFLSSPPLMDRLFSFSEQTTPMPIRDQGENGDGLGDNVYPTECGRAEAVT